MDAPPTQYRRDTPTPVRSGQAGPHRRLAEVVQRHLLRPAAPPPTPYGDRAWGQVCQWLNGQATDTRPAQRLILDSACGTGESTAALARRHPRSRVIGVDQSAHRLSHGQRKLDAQWPANALLVRAEVTELWLRMAQAGWRLHRHLLLYPNPWPKPGHLQRRWHGHGLWPCLLMLGGQLELRTNWDIYAQEFEQALLLSGRAAQRAAWRPLTPLTPFERKYALAGHGLWRVCADLRP